MHFLPNPPDSSMNIAQRSDRLVALRQNGITAKTSREAGAYE